MTDPTTETVDSNRAKPLAVRCPGCKELIFNETLNLKTHKLVCPQDLKMRLQKLEERLDGIEGTVDELEQAPVPEPAVALTVGDWPDDEDDSVDTPSEAPAPIAAADHVNAASDDEDDDYFDDEPTAAPLGGSLYTPGTGPLT